MANNATPTNPKLRGIPFNTESVSDSNAFAPIYDPKAIRFARRVNFGFAVLLGIGAFALACFFLTSEPIARLASEGAFSVFFSLVLPIIICGIGFIVIKTITPRLGFRLDLAYSATANSLRDWLSTNAVSPLEGDSDIYEAAQAVAQQSPQAIELVVNPDLKNDKLKLDSSGRYRLILN